MPQPFSAVSQSVHRKTVLGQLHGPTPSGLRQGMAQDNGPLARGHAQQSSQPKPAALLVLTTELIRRKLWLD